MKKNKKSQLNKIDGKSKDVWGEKLEKLQQEFPEVLSENEVDCDQLKRLVGDDNVAEGERYSFSWAGKSKAFQEIKRQTTKTLKPDRKESVDFDNTDNLFIEGENLEVLKILQKSYHNKVKMIYIDPPYNTGKDFIYNDDFRRTKEEEEKEAGNKDEEGKIKQGLVKNTKDKGHYHSNWLNMMYPRLYLARNLLKDDGVIFVSIDDNEVHNLRMIMNEIFGEENFVANIIWQKKYTISNDAKYFSDNHDHILVYGKVKDFLKLKGIPRTEKQNERYKNPDNDPRGLWMSQPLHAKSGNTKSFKYKFENGVVWKPPKGTYPRYSKESLKKFERENRIWLGEDEKSVPRLKKYLEDMGDITPATLWFYDEVGNNDQGNRELKSLDMGGLFSNPKPTKLIKRMLQLSTEKDDVILDFFAGSGSTAHATMEQNVEDRENRKHIMIQLPEETDKDSEAKKSGYENIADIAKERIRRAGKKIKKGKGGKLDFDKNNLDLGFKVFKLSDSNFKQWIREEVKDKEKLQQKLEDSIENLDKDSKEENILFELMLKLGIDPNASVEDKKDYFVVDERELIICLENKITKKIIDRIIEEEPHVFVCLDGAFICNDELKTNTSLQMKSKEIEFKVV